MIKNHALKPAELSRHCVFASAKIGNKFCFAKFLQLFLQNCCKIVMGERKKSIWVVANVLNTISLAASVVLLVSMSIEVADRADDLLSEWYRTLQLVVCSIFFATAVFRLLIPRYRWRHWFRDVLFALLSIPYINILEWGGVALESRYERIVAFAPV